MSQSQRMELWSWVTIHSLGLLCVAALAQSRVYDTFFDPRHPITFFVSRIELYFLFSHMKFSLHTATHFIIYFFK